MPPVQLFKALSDPTRLELINRLCTGENFTVTSISTGLTLTRQGTRKHLQILSDAKIIDIKYQGRSSTVILNPEAFEKAKSFITELEQKWDKRLQSLRSFVEESQENN